MRNIKRYKIVKIVTVKFNLIIKTDLIHVE